MWLYLSTCRSLKEAEVLSEKRNCFCWQLAEFGVLKVILGVSLCLVKHGAMKMYGGVRCSSTHFNLCAVCR